jgi:hypothetical protein
MMFPFGYRWKPTPAPLPRGEYNMVPSWEGQGGGSHSQRKVTP